MAMSKNHKAALAQGRYEARVLKRYLRAFPNRRPGRPITTESLRAGIGRIEERLASEPDALRRVVLLQRRLDATEALSQVSASDDVAALEDEFIANVGSYSERKGITYAAWRDAGVPAPVLRRAGLRRKQ